MKKIFVLFVPFVACFIVGCSHKAEHADLVIHNAIVYTLDDMNTISEAIAIKDGKIIETGAERYILNKYSAGEYVDAKGRPVYPGFFDAHCHILGYGRTFLEVDLKGVDSWEKTVQKVKDFAKTSTSKWIIGRGWDQNLWKDKKFPDKKLLDEAFPDQPVFLTRVDGHAAICNSKAIQETGVDLNASVTGGTFLFENEEFTGISIDNAMDLISAKIPDYSEADQRKALLLAGVNTSSYGLTTLCDAGSKPQTFKLIETLQKENKFTPRVYGMLIPDKDGFDFATKNKHYNVNDKMVIRSFKLVADGALGSRGACLKAPYSDSPEIHGKILYAFSDYEEFLNKAYDLDYQVNTHAIGDSANAMMLRLYGKMLEKTNDNRWRIEHAQIMDTADIQFFSKYSVIPSVQPTHSVSDMPWAKDRVGERIVGGYNFQSLLEQNGIIALGTDFPVEDINPFKTFYAAVTGKYYDGRTIEGLSNNVLSRQDAILGMTKWAAMAAFMEDKLGSIEKGKLADIIILSKDIMKVDEKEILSTTVIETFINGKRVHSLE